MKKILGLDLGTTSIGWALVNEAENENEKSSIIKLGVRVNPLTVDEQQNFEKGKSITTNADRTLKRSMRRNLQRYKLRRENLIEILKENGFINDETILSENGNYTTFETYRLRAKAATEEITLEQFARVLLMINKKRGYKSSRKAKGIEEGVLIDGKDVAIILDNQNLTVGQYSLQILKSGKQDYNQYYPSDLQKEFDRIFERQMTFYPDILTVKLKKELTDKKRDAVWAICAQEFKNKGLELVGTKRKGNTAEQKIENYTWRVKGLTEKLDLEQLVVVLQQINVQKNASSGYLGAISDRSKELYFNKQTVGQYQMAVLDKNPNASLRNMIFYRQDYLYEFNTVWDKQAEYHPKLTNELKELICDGKELNSKIKGGIFYQRPLKSQKGLISFCEFESRKIEVEIDGKKKIKTVGSRVIPRSSPLFQEFKIWQRLNDIEIFPANEKNKKRKPNERRLDQSEKELLFSKLSIKETLSKSQALSLLDLQEFDMNFNSIDGNKTQYELFKAYKRIIELSGHEVNNDFSVDDIDKIFKHLGINTEILYFDSEKSLDEQPMYRLYHLLYSFEDDKSNTGNEHLISKLKNIYGFETKYAKILANVDFQKDYGSLSAKAIAKILPHLKDGDRYDIACVMAGYGKHSKSSLTKEELENKTYKNQLDPVIKNSLRNPVVEKILNQMVNVINMIVNTYCDKDENGEAIKRPFYEIRIELSRELKKNADERALLTDSINTNTNEIKKLKEELKEKFPIFQNQEPSRNDIIRYKLWLELAPNGHKPLYGSKENLQREISPAILFSKEIEIEHIIPKARLFDDSFSNKTLTFSSDNKDKGNMTALDYVTKVDNNLEGYIDRIIRVCGTKTTKSIANKITKSIKAESKTFEAFYKDYEKSLKKQKEKLEKWNNATENERKKMTKPWSIMSSVERKIEVINKFYSGKLKKLIITESELPEGFINRDLANTQYITKVAKEMLGDLAKYVVSTTGSITERLREDWQLVDVMKELNWDKYDKLGLTEIIEKEDYNDNKIKIRKIIDWNKRNDHRHHAMDALTVAFTKRQFIQYLNNLNSRRTNDDTGISNTDKDDGEQTSITTEDVILNTRDVLGIEQKELKRDEYKGKLRFIAPKLVDKNGNDIPFRVEAKRHLENTLISIKAKNKVTTQNINVTKKSGGANKKIQQTPRGQLHNETIYGSQKQYVIKEETVNAKFDVKRIATVTKPVYREALLKRLEQFNNDPKKAFTGSNALSKKPIWLDELHVEQVPEQVKTTSFETIYTIRKEVSPDLKIDKVIDNKVREKLEERLKKFNGNAKQAFSNLDENPIWLNEDKGIAIKRVTISGVSNAESLHDKRDKDGNLIFDENGKKQPADFVNTGNNHHVAIYRDADGNLQENVVSFYEAVTRRNLGQPIIDKGEYKYKDTDGKIIVVEGSKFLFSMKQNEYFVFPKIEKKEKVNEDTGEIMEEEVITFNPNEIDLLDPDNYHLISPNLFRVQKFSFKNYVFRHHLETSIKDASSNLRGITWTDFRSSKGLDQIVKVRINHIGQIISVGEY